MDISQFLNELLEAISPLDLVEKIDISTEVFILKGRIILKNDLYLQVYYNEKTGTTAYALIKNKSRIWGIDFDNLRGWHLHPIDDPNSHQEIPPKSIKETINELVKIWNLIV